METFPIGIIGCGVISRTYLRDIRSIYSGRDGIRLEIAACAGRDPERTKAYAEENHIPRCETTEEMLADPDIRIILNLTPPDQHYAINRAVLLSGKHLFSEKPFALTFEEALELHRLAGQKGLKAGSAPDTFLGAGLSRARYLLEQGAVGRPLYATAHMMSHGMETWHPSPEPFYRHGGGPLYDMGPYYLSALVSLLGSIKTIQAVSGKGAAERQFYCGERAGQPFPVETPTYYAALLQTESGVPVDFTVSFDVWDSTLPLLEIYGQEGTLRVPDPNKTDGMPALIRRESVLQREGIEIAPSLLARLAEPDALRAGFPADGEYTRGLGVLQLAKAIAYDAVNPADSAFAVHITEAICGILQAAKTGEAYRMQTSAGPLPR